MSFIHFANYYVTVMKVSALIFCYEDCQKVGVHFYCLFQGDESMQILCSGKISFGLPWRHVSHSHRKLQSQIQGTTLANSSQNSIYLRGFILTSKCLKNFAYMTK